MTVVRDRSRHDAPGRPRSGAQPPIAPSGATAAPLSRRERTALDAATGARLPVVLVLVSLALALVVRPVAQRRVNRMREEINLVADPAQSDVATIRLDLALEAAARRGYALTGDIQLAREITTSLQRRQLAESRLRQRAHRLGVAPTLAFAQLAARLSAFDADLDSLEASGIVRSEPAVAMRDRQRLFDDAMVATQQLDAAIVRAADARRSAIGATENTVAVLTALLVLLGLGAALLVARLGNRYRAVALRLHESDARFRQIAENLSTVVWLSDPGFQHVLYVNSAYERLWGRSPERLYAEPDSFMDAVYPEDRDRVRTALATLPGSGTEVEFRVVRPAGDVRWVRGRGFPVRDESGRVFRMAGLLEDITESRQHRLERERLLANERRAREAAEQRRRELEQVTESRARLVRGFTHDVKNPLGAADGFLALLDEGVQGELEAPQREWVGKARRLIGHALELIRHLLEFAQAEAGELEVRPSQTDIAALVREVADAFRAQIAARDQALALEVPAQLPSVRTDGTRVRQVVGNLVSNAVKYTPPGGHIAIRARVEGEPSEPDGARLAISVRDDGLGIPDDKLPSLFTEFTRLSPNAAEGAGIGLAISQRIARALGAAITVESRVGEGSTFTLHLPLAADT